MTSAAPARTAHVRRCLIPQVYRARRGVATATRGLSFIDGGQANGIETTVRHGAATFANPDIYTFLEDEDNHPHRCRHEQDSVRRNGKDVKPDGVVCPNSHE